MMNTITKKLFFAMTALLLVLFTACEMPGMEQSEYSSKSLKEEKLLTLSFVDEVPVMTSNTSPWGTASCSSKYSSSYDAWRAFDGNDTSASASRWISQMGPMPAWVAFDFKVYKRITRYYILPEYSSSIKDRCPKDFRLQGYNGSSWVTVDTRTNISWYGSGKYFTTATPGYYTKYRLYVDATNRASSQINTGVVSIRQFKMEETTSSFVDEVPVMTSNTSPWGTAACSSRYSSSYDAWKAFDGNDTSSSASRWISSIGPMPAWISFDFGSYKRVTSYYILPEYSSSIKDRCPKDFRLQGFNGSLWITVDSKSNISWNGSGQYFTVTTPGYYTKYRLYVDATNRASSQTNTGVVSIRQFKMDQ